MDITNLKTQQNSYENIEYFKQETVLSATNFFQAAIDALSVSPSLEKVVILNQVPRYDPANVDPLSLKPALSQLYNNTITQLWMSSSLKDRIVLGSHNIECSGAIKEARYRETKSVKFDGIHLFGSSGQKAYTLSVLNILQAVHLTSSDYAYHQSCSQYQRQKNGRQNGMEKRNDY